MEELALHQILVIVWMDILETDVKMVCSRGLVLHHQHAHAFYNTCTAPDTYNGVAGYSGDQCQNGTS